MEAPVKIHLLTAGYVAWWCLVINAACGLAAHAIFYTAPDPRDSVLHDLGTLCLLVRLVFIRPLVSVNLRTTESHDL